MNIGRERRHSAGKILVMLAVLPVLAMCSRTSDRPPVSARDTAAPAQRSIVATNADQDTFDLISVSGSALPARYRGAAFQWECPMTVRSMWIVLARDSTLEMQSQGDVVCSEATKKPATETWRGRYVVRADS